MDLENFCTVEFLVVDLGGVGRVLGIFEKFLKIRNIRIFQIQNAKRTIRTPRICFKLSRNVDIYPRSMHATGQLRKLRHSGLAANFVSKIRRFWGGQKIRKWRKIAIFRAPIGSGPILIDRKLNFTPRTCVILVFLFEIPDFSIFW